MMLPHPAQGQTTPAEQLEGQDQTGNECQLDSREREVAVRATAVCTLRGALYWMYCITSIPTQKAGECNGSDCYIV